MHFVDPNISPNMDRLVGGSQSNGLHRLPPYTPRDSEEMEQPQYPMAMERASTPRQRKPHAEQKRSRLSMLELNARTLFHEVKECFPKLSFPKFKGRNGRLEETRKEKSRNRKKDKSSSMASSSVSLLLPISRAATPSFILDTPTPDGDQFNQTRLELEEPTTFARGRARKADIFLRAATQADSRLSVASSIAWTFMETSGVARGAKRAIENDLRSRRRHRDRSVPSEPVARTYTPNPYVGGLFPHSAIRNSRFGDDEFAGQVDFSVRSPSSRGGDTFAPQTPWRHFSEADYALESDFLNSDTESASQAPRVDSDDQPFTGHISEVAETFHRDDEPGSKPTLDETLLQLKLPTIAAVGTTDVEFVKTHRARASRASRGRFRVAASPTTAGAQSPSGSSIDRGSPIRKRRSRPPSANASKSYEEASAPVNSPDRSAHVTPIKNRQLGRSNEGSRHLPGQHIARHHGHQKSSVVLTEADLNIQVMPGCLKRRLSCQILGKGQDKDKNDEETIGRRDQVVGGFVSARGNEVDDVALMGVEGVRPKPGQVTTANEGSSAISYFGKPVLQVNTGVGSGKQVAGPSEALEELQISQPRPFNPQPHPSSFSGEDISILRSPSQDSWNQSHSALFTTVTNHLRGLNFSPVPEESVTASDEDNHKQKGNNFNCTNEPSSSFQYQTPEPVLYHPSAELRPSEAPRYWPSPENTLPEPALVGYCHSPEIRSSEPTLAGYNHSPEIRPLKPAPSGYCHSPEIRSSEPALSGYNHSPEIRPLEPVPIGYLPSPALPPSEAVVSHSSSRLESFPCLDGARSPTKSQAKSPTRGKSSLDKPKPAPLPKPAYLRGSPTRLSLNRISQENSTVTAPLIPENLNKSDELRVDSDPEDLYNATPPGPNQRTRPENYRDSPTSTCGTRPRPRGAFPKTPQSAHVRIPSEDYYNSAPPTTRPPQYRDSFTSPSPRKRDTKPKSSGRRDNPDLNSDSKLKEHNPSGHPASQSASRTQAEDSNRTSGRSGDHPHRDSDSKEHKASRRSGHRASPSASRKKGESCYPTSGRSQDHPDSDSNSDSDSEEQKPFRHSGNRASPAASRKKGESYYRTSGRSEDRPLVSKSSQSRKDLYQNKNSNPDLGIHRSKGKEPYQRDESVTWDPQSEGTSAPNREHKKQNTPHGLFGTPFARDTRIPRSGPAEEYVYNLPASSDRFPVRVPETPTNRRGQPRPTDRDSLDNFTPSRPPRSSEGAFRSILKKQPSTNSCRGPKKVNISQTPPQYINPTSRARAVSSASALQQPEAYPRDANVRECNPPRSAQALAGQPYTILPRSFGDSAWRETINGVEQARPSQHCRSQDLVRRGFAESAPPSPLCDPPPPPPQGDRTQEFVNQLNTSSNFEHFVPDLRRAVENEHQTTVLLTILSNLPLVPECELAIRSKTSPDCNDKTSWLEQQGNLPPTPSKEYDQKPASFFSSNITEDIPATLSKSFDELDSGLISYSDDEVIPGLSFSSDDAEDTPAEDLPGTPSEGSDTPTLNFHFNFVLDEVADIPAEDTSESSSEMASTSRLQVRGMNETKLRAVEDAKKMQNAAEDLCATTGRAPPKYQLMELIGKGSFGRVYVGTHTETKDLVAIKVLNMEEADMANPKGSDAFSDIQKEITALRTLRDSSAKNINVVIEAEHYGSTVWLVTEYCSGGSISTLMKPTAPNGLGENWVIPIVREVAEAIMWVHKVGLIHRDIKAANVLIGESGSLQLCDFGVAGIAEGKLSQDKRTTIIGTPHWMAPELLLGPQGGSYGKEIDIWAFGALIFEIATGFPPHVKNGLRSMEALVESLKLGSADFDPQLKGDQYSAGLKDIIAYCMERDVEKRPTIEELQKHEYIANTEAEYPTASLASLVIAYRVWTDQGGSRQSLFHQGGAAEDISGLSAPALSDDWNFSTTTNFDAQVSQISTSLDIDAVYAGNAVEFKEDTVRPKQSARRRRPPPEKLVAMPPPLAKVFDPNTLSDYKTSSQNHYNMAPQQYNQPPPDLQETPPSQYNQGPGLNFASDLPLRSDTGRTSTRESMIDLGGHDMETGLSSFPDMGTMKPGARQAEDDGYSDFHRPALSDPADINPNRRTQDWKFPSMAPPASADPEVSRFPASSYELPRPSITPGAGGRPTLVHHPTEPLGGAFGGGLAPAALPTMDRRSVAESLIDLDMSMPDSYASDIVRPSTANSDVGSTSSEHLNTGNPFEFERHVSYVAPNNGYEPSMYHEEDTRINLDRDSRIDLDMAMDPSPHRDINDISDFSDPEGGRSSGEFGSMGPGPTSHPNNVSQGQTYTIDRFPSLGAPPSAAALTGTAPRAEMASEMSRLFSGMTGQLEAFRDSYGAMDLTSSRNGGAAGRRK